VATNVEYQFSVDTPQWILTYAGVDITADITSMVREVIYDDHLDDAAAALEIVLEDHQKLWQGPWYPSQGDLIELRIGYQGASLLPCGEFQVDELELSGPPDVFTIRGLAAWITPAMRTPYSIGYEQQTLSDIAAAVAAKYNLIMIDNTTNTLDVTFQRLTQSQETDLAFLRRIALENGYNFSVRGSQIVFYTLSALEALPPAAALSRSDVVAFKITDKTHHIFKAAALNYFDAFQKQLISQQAASAAILPTGDTLKLLVRAENGQQALLKAETGLHLHNKEKIRVRLTSRGSVALVAGNIVAISGFGTPDGTYLIETARHRLSRRGGYLTEISARQLNAATTLESPVA
jgi:phage protein D